MKAVRGAITIKGNTEKEIESKTINLLKEIINRNNIHVEEIVSAIFTVTEDINAAFPAAAARKIGWNTVPMICAVEIPVPGSLKLCIRVLIHLERSIKEKVNHVYLEGASILRPDL